jgi:hypothetical protein
MQRWKNGGQEAALTHRVFASVDTHVTVDAGQALEVKVLEGGCGVHDGWGQGNDVPTRLQ